MKIDLTAATAPMLGGCVSQSTHDRQTAELQQARAQAAAEQGQINKMQQEQRWVVGGVTSPMTPPPVARSSSASWPGIEEDAVAILKQRRL
jgi:hypothetical protein